MADLHKKRVSRVLPGLTTEYTIVSMPAWAWHWLDTMVKEYFPEGYKSFISECAAHSDGQRPLADILEGFARLFREDYYRLTNDNWPLAENAPPAARTVMPAYNFPKAVKLFGFVPFATTWDNVLTRRGIRSLSNGS
jgi:hypothetical protein